MKKYIFLSAVIAATIISYTAIGQTTMNHSEGTSSASACQLKTAMRQLWEDHVTWTRNVILCLTDDLPGADQAVKRLLKNQDDIGNAVSSFYGEEAGKKLTELLYDNNKIAADVVKAAKAGNSQQLDEANKKCF